MSHGVLWVALLSVLVGLGLLNWSWWCQNVEKVYYTAAVIAAILALYTYHQNSRLERARWITSLYEKFYEDKNGTGKLKSTRDQLDDEAADSSEIGRLVQDETHDFTDYLNFFEFVAILKHRGQLTHDDVKDLFGFYLESMKKHTKVVAYVQDDRKGFEQLSNLLKTTWK